MLAVALVMRVHCGGLGLLITKLINLVSDMPVTVGSIVVNPVLIIAGSSV